MIRPWYISYPRITVACTLWTIVSIVAVSLIIYDPIEPSILYQRSDIFPPTWPMYIFNSIAAVYLHIWGWSGIGMLGIMTVTGCNVLRILRVRYTSLIAACLLVCANAMWCAHVGYDPFARVIAGGWFGRICHKMLVYASHGKYVEYVIRGMLAVCGMATCKTWWIRYVTPYVAYMYRAVLYPVASRLRYNSRYIFPSLLHEHIAHESQQEILSDESIFFDAFWHKTRSYQTRVTTSLYEEPRAASESYMSGDDTVPSDNHATNTYHGAQAQNSYDTSYTAVSAHHHNHEHVLKHPKAELLHSGTSLSNEPDEVGRQQAQRLEEKLATFGITGHVTNITCGPVVTIFSYQPDKAVKVANITAREDDLRLALEAVSLRIIAPIPGTSVVGFEVSRPQPQAVMLQQLITSSSFWSDDVDLPIALGSDTAGNPFIGDLTDMPHLLVAGSTGSGKSVALHGFLVSLLFRCHPDSMKCVLIDPKRLEFASYHTIPHLAAPVITQQRSVVKTFEWLVQEMERRYDVLSQAGVRNIAEYHNRYGVEQLPYLVVVVDELADLMMGVGKDIEHYIARIAQMARAAGIHAIVATQRPSVDVVTGMIKVNFLSRVAFKVTSKIDSRTIIDQPGAEKLLGRGDMLHLDSRGVLHRLHGGLITQDEIDSVIQHWCNQPYEHTYMSDPAQQERDNQAADSNDALYHDVAAYVRTCDTISISLIQRRFRIGYNRSARLVDALERDGIVSSADANKMRKVLQ